MVPAGTNPVFSFYHLFTSQPSIAAENVEERNVNGSFMLDPE